MRYGESVCKSDILNKGICQSVLVGTSWAPDLASQNPRIRGPWPLCTFNGRYRRMALLVSTSPGAEAPAFAGPVAAQWFHSTTSDEAERVRHRVTPIRLQFLFSAWDLRGCAQASTRPGGAARIVPRSSSRSEPSSSDCVIGANMASSAHGASERRGSGRANGAPRWLTPPGRGRSRCGRRPPAEPPGCLRASKGRNGGLQDLG